MYQDFPVDQTVHKSARAASITHASADKVRSRVAFGTEQSEQEKLNNKPTFSLWFSFF